MGCCCCKKSPEDEVGVIADPRKKFGRVCTKCSKGSFCMKCKKLLGQNKMRLCNNCKREDGKCFVCGVNEGEVPPTICKMCEVFGYCSWCGKNPVAA